MSTLRQIAAVLDQILTEHHSSSYDGVTCIAPGCGRPWYDDGGHHHVTAVLLRRLTAVCACGHPYGDHQRPAQSTDTPGRCRPPAAFCGCAAYHGPT